MMTIGRMNRLLSLRPELAAGHHGFGVVSSSSSKPKPLLRQASLSLSLSSSSETQTLPSQSLAASALGLDPAQNRFHAPIVYHEKYSFDGWPETHTFPMNKFARIAHSLLHTCKATHPTTSPLPRPLVRRLDDLFRPLDVSQIPMDIWFPEDLIHSDFLNRFLAGQLTPHECRTIGFREQTCRPELIERTVLEVAGTVLACQLALQYGIACNTAGGTHHAHPTMGAGYTILNDLAVAAHVLTRVLVPPVQQQQQQQQQQTMVAVVERVLVIDCDVHQGDGTAKFHLPGMPLEGKLFTLSLHCASNYPHVKANSTLDVGLPDGMQDDEYLEILQDSMDKVINQVQPDLVIYDAGVDVFRDDRLGRLNLSEEGIRKRDRLVLDYCVSHQIPVASVVGGGYDRDVDALARRHALVLEEAGFVWRKHKLWTARDKS